MPYEIEQTNHNNCPDDTYDSIIEDVKDVGIITHANHPEWKAEAKFDFRFVINYPDADYPTLTKRVSQKLTAPGRFRGSELYLIAKAVLGEVPTKLDVRTLIDKHCRVVVTVRNGWSNVTQVLPPAPQQATAQRTAPILGRPETFVLPSYPET